MIPVQEPKRITSAFGVVRMLPKIGKNVHDGVDMVSDSGCIDLVAMLDGVVIDDRDDYNEALRWKDKHHSVGNRIVVKSVLNGKTYFWSYYHMVINHCSVGEKIAKGQLVGTYGDVGISFGAHVHVIAWDEHWKVIDPQILLEA